MSKLWTPRPGLHLLRGYATILNPDGSVAYEEEAITENALADEGEQDVLNVYFRATARPSFYLALLTATPTDTTTMATMTETTGGGYARQQILDTDWAAPVLNAGDYQTTAAEKTFGPATGANWTGLTYVALVTASTGTAGKFICYLALAASTTVNVGQSFKYTLTQKAQ